MIVEMILLLDSVEDSVEWIKTNSPPDLIFMDIQLADGLSFQIFDQVEVKSPIVFTTAYDEYALNAFKVNSIDYLLKPLEKEALANAIKKYKEIYSKQQAFNWQSLSSEFFKPTEYFKQRFLIKTGNAYAYLNLEEILYFFSEDGISFAINKGGQRFIIDHTLDKISEQLNPSNFFRISRKYVVGLSSIKKIHPYLNSRLKLELLESSNDDFVVSREKVKEFKSWIDS